MLNGPRTVVGYVDSGVTHTGGGVYEVLLLMTFCRKHLLHLMNDRYVVGFGLYSETSELLTLTVQFLVKRTQYLFEGKLVFILHYLPLIFTSGSTPGWRRRRCSRYSATCVTLSPAYTRSTLLSSTGTWRYGISSFPVHSRPKSVLVGSCFGMYCPVLSYVSTLHGILVNLIW